MSTLVAEPITAYRRARLGPMPSMRKGESLPPFMSVHARERHGERWEGALRGFGLEAVATCAKVEDFEARRRELRELQRGLPGRKVNIGPLPHSPVVPDEVCSCGFYAVPRVEALYHDNYGGDCSLTVELSGRVIQHDPAPLGGYARSPHLAVWRAERQRVVAVHVDRYCYCGRQASTLRTFTNATYAVCDACTAKQWPSMPKGLLTTTPAEIAGELGIDVQWGPDRPADRSRQRVQGRAYAAAMGRLRDEFRDRFDALLREEREARGLERTDRQEAAA